MVMMIVFSHYIRPDHHHTLGSVIYQHTESHVSIVPALRLHAALLLCGNFTSYQK